LLLAALSLLYLPVWSSFLYFAVLYFKCHSKSFAYNLVKFSTCTIQFLLWLLLFLHRSSKLLSPGYILLVTLLFLILLRYTLEILSRWNKIFYKMLPVYFTPEL